LLRTNMHLFRLSPEEILLRIGLAFAFLYPPFAAFSDPYSWIGYFPAALADLVAPHGILLLHTFGVIEIVLALWILFGKRIFIPSVTATVLLLAIVVANPSQFPILFRDVALAFIGLSLAIAHRPHHA